MAGLLMQCCKSYLESRQARIEIGKVRKSG